MLHGKGPKKKVIYFVPWCGSPEVKRTLLIFCQRRRPFCRKAQLGMRPMCYRSVSVNKCKLSEIDELTVVILWGPWRKFTSSVIEV